MPSFGTVSDYFLDTGRLRVIFNYLLIWLEGAPETTKFKVLEDISFRVGLITGSPSISPTLTAPKEILQNLRESIHYFLAIETKLVQELMQLLVKSPCNTETLMQKVWIVQYLSR